LCKAQDQQYKTRACSLKEPEDTIKSAEPHDHEEEKPHAEDRMYSMKEAQSPTVNEIEERISIENMISQWRPL
jgi:hypothetical protein